MMRLFPSLLIAVSIGPVAYGQSSPEAFEPETVRTFPAVRDLALSSTGDECYFSAQSLFAEVSVVMVMVRSGEEWGPAEVAPFSGNYIDLEPFLSPDGLRLYFASNRPIGPEDQTEDFDIWYVEREADDADWSEPVNLGTPVNTDGNEFYPAVTDSGNLYFTSDGKGSLGKDDIFVSRYNNGTYEIPESLGDAINSAGYEFNAYVSPDESLLIFTAYNRSDGLGSGDLYLSRRDVEGNWETAQHLGAGINSERMDFCPFFDPQTEVLYFTSKREDLPKPPFAFDSAQSLRQVLWQNENGQSRLYRVPFKAGLTK